MAGPATNVATMTVLGKTMGRKSLIIYLATIIVGALVFGLLTNLFIPANFIFKKVIHIHGEGHKMLPEWLLLVSAFLLLFFILGGYFFQRNQKANKMKKVKGITLIVEGMTCSHCELNVKRNLEALEGISSVIADKNTRSVKLTVAKSTSKK